MMRWLVVMLVLAGTLSAALAQTAAQLPSGYVWGNATASAAPAQAATQPSLLDRAFCATQGGIITRNSSTWLCLTPGTSGRALVSGGAGANLAYSVLGIVGGGTNCSAASGTCLDNITAFSGTGIQRRTGAGTYTFGTTSTVPEGGTGATTFTSNAPLIGAGTSALTQGTRSGTTTSFATTSGSPVGGNCTSWDGSGNLVDAGSPCGSGGGGSGTVSSGTAGQIGYYASNGTTISGNANLTILSAAVTVGVAGSTVGTVAFANATSGTIKITPPAGALGSAVLTLPDATDTLTGKATTDTFTNKTITSSTNTVGVNALNGGSNASANSVWRGDATWASYALQSNIWQGTANSPVDAAALKSAGLFQSLTYSATTTLDLHTFINGVLVITGNITFANPTNADAGQSGCFYVVQSGGPFTASWGSNWWAPGGVAVGLVLSTAANSTDLICYQVQNSGIVFATINQAAKH